MYFDICYYKRMYVRCFCLRGFKNTKTNQAT
nr:MAG TPA: hypothetical protein [Caudoviricetes sp.]